jgi:hypothetical protein
MCVRAYTRHAATYASCLQPRFGAYGATAGAGNLYYPSKCSQSLMYICVPARCPTRSLPISVDLISAAQMMGGQPVAMIGVRGGRPRQQQLYATDDMFTYAPSKRTASMAACMHPLVLPPKPQLAHTCACFSQRPHAPATADCRQDVLL